MNSTRARTGLTKLLVGISGLTALILATFAGAESPQEAPEVKPIAGVWLAPMPPFTPTGAAAQTQEKIKTLKEWHQAKVFDATVLLDLPPTFVDHQDSTRRANAIIKEVGGQFIIATLPVGKQGWEASGNERFAKKAAALGALYDASKAMSQTQWLETLKDVESDTWAWVLEKQVRIPTPDQGARLAGEFVQFARAEHKKPVIWLSGQALTHGKQFEELMKRICEATRADAEAFVWMDLPAESLEAGESRWRETLDELLDKILNLTPREKTVVQWMNNPSWPTRDVEGTKAYISACQAKGINRFCVLVNLQRLEQDPWRDFYRTLPRISAAVAR